MTEIWRPPEPDISKLDPNDFTFRYQQTVPDRAEHDHIQAIRKKMMREIGGKVLENLKPGVEYSIILRSEVRREGKLKANTHDMMAWVRKTPVDGA